MFQELAPHPHTRAAKQKSDDKRPPERKRKKPTILDLSRLAAEHPDIDYLTPCWEAVLKAFYGYALEDRDIENLLIVTKRPRAFWEARRDGGKPFSELWARVGRRGQKTSTTALISIYETLFGGHEKHLMAGERGRINILSHGKDGSATLARFVEIYCEALGLAFKRETSGIGKNSRELFAISQDGKRARFDIAITPPTMKATRGPASPMNVFDEFAFLGSEENENVNSDVEVMAAAKPSMLQFKSTNPKTVVISSPLGEVGLFHKTIEEFLAHETNDEVLAVSGASWVFNPEGASIEMTHKLERDPDKHAREYGAVPSGAEGVAFVKEDVVNAFVPRTGVFEWGRPFMMLDSSGGGNTFACALAVCGSPTDVRIQKKIRTADGSIVVLRGPDGQPLLEDPAEKSIVRIGSVFGFKGDEIRRIGMDAVIQRIAEEAKVNGCNYVFADQYGAPFLASALRMCGVELRWFNHTNESKHHSVVLLRWLMRDGLFSIVEHEGLLHDLKTYPRRVRGGRFVYGHPATTGHHNDFASMLLTFGHAMNAMSESGGIIGKDANGQEFTIEKAPKQVAGGRTEWIPKDSSWLDKIKAKQAA